jgi:DNA polymerase epsilon subunit 2
LPERRSFADAAMKVSLDILRRVYETLQDQGDRTDDQRKDALEPDNHLFFINAYEMPLWHWSQERGTFEKYTSFFFTIRGLNLCRAGNPLTISGSAESRISVFRDRLNIIRQCVLRNEHFAPSTLPSHDREKLVTVRVSQE